MNYTIMKDSEDITDSEGYMAIATSDFSFIILRISKNGQ